MSTRDYLMIDSGRQIDSPKVLSYMTFMRLRSISHGTIVAWELKNDCTITKSQRNYCENRWYAAMTI